MSRFSGRLRSAIYGLADEAWRVRGAWKMETRRARAEKLRVEDPDQYQRFLGMATDEGQRLAEKDPDGFVAFVLAETERS